MSLYLDPPLTPRRGATLSAVGVCRISTAHQDAKSLEDQKALLTRHLELRYPGEVRWEFLSTTDSGEALDRDDLRRLDALIASRSVDLILAEDLGRICRRIHALIICEDCQDSGTRLMTINDGVDTAVRGWKTHATFAALRHESYNEDTGARIRRSARNRFATDGTIATHIYGYLKPPGVKTDDLVSKDPEAGPVYDRWFRMLEDGATYAEVADWLNSRGIRPGPWTKSDTWDVASVRRATLNPILKGVRVHNEKMSRRVNSTGRRRSVDAPPSERLERPVPHLAFIDPARYDRVLALIKGRNAKYRRKGADGVDALQGLPRSRTPWPAQHLACGTCGRPFYRGGHGNKGRMMCSGAHNYKCWNAATCDAEDAARRIARAVLDEVAALPDFDAGFLANVAAEVARARAAEGARAAALGRRRKDAQARVDSLMDLLLDNPSSTALRERLRRLEADLERVDREGSELEASARGEAPLPSMGRIKQIALDAFAGLARDSPEFARLMRRVVPRLEVRPVRLCDGGGVELRAHVRLELAGLVPEARGLGDAGGCLARDLVVDLFDPPQRARHLDAVRALLGLGRTQDQAADALGITQAAVAKAVALGRIMVRMGLDRPYLELDEPPHDLGRMRRHLHPRYRFEPLPSHHRAPGGTAIGPPRPSPGGISPP